MPFEPVASRPVFLYSGAASGGGRQALNHPSPYLQKQSFNHSTIPLKSMNRAGSCIESITSSQISGYPSPSSLASPLASAHADSSGIGRTPLLSAKFPFVS